MIVEDSTEIGEQIAAFYESEGYAVELASDGRMALQKLRSSEDLPGVILLDLMMPGMDGSQFRQEQEKDPHISSIPVLLMTADANADVKAMRVGATGYLRKPVELETLVKVAEKFCQL